MESVCALCSCYFRVIFLKTWQTSSVVPEPHPTQLQTLLKALVSQRHFVFGRRLPDSNTNTEDLLTVSWWSAFTIGWRPSRSRKSPLPCSQNIFQSSEISCTHFWKKKGNFEKIEFWQTGWSGEGNALRFWRTFPVPELFVGQAIHHPVETRVHVRDDQGVQMQFDRELILVVSQLRIDSVQLISRFQWKFSDTSSLHMFILHTDAPWSSTSNMRIRYLPPWRKMETNKWQTRQRWCTASSPTWTSPHFLFVVAVYLVAPATQHIPKFSHLIVVFMWKVKVGLLRRPTRFLLLLTCTKIWE